MSIIKKVEEELYFIIARYCLGERVEKLINGIISSLNDPTVMLIEWNEIDVQQIAKNRLSELHNISEEKIIENPLSKEQVIMVINILKNNYDSNYGITWDSINSALDNIDLLGIKGYLKKSELNEAVETIEALFNFIERQELYKIKIAELQEHLKNASSAFIFLKEEIQKFENKKE